MDDDVRHLQQRLLEFAEARDWRQFHTPRNLLLALSGEVGELSELLQWVPDGGVDEWLVDPSNRAKFESEIADVFIYLLYLAESANIDISQAAREKITLNEARFPPS